MFATNGPERSTHRNGPAVPLLPTRLFRRHARDVAHLPARAVLALAVVVQMRAGLGQHARPGVNLGPDQVLHLDSAAPACGAERPPGHGANVLLELARLRALDG